MLYFGDLPARSDHGARHPALGLVFAGLYALSGSFLAAWLAHFAAVIRWRGGSG